MFRKLIRFYKAIYHLSREQEGLKMMVGKVLSNQIKSLPITSLHDAEFKVFSQFGDDGIIQYLINNVPISNKVFIEFGVEDYKESNTRFLLMNNNWRGLIMDASEENIKEIQHEDIYWKYELTAKATFITRENINQLIKDAGLSGEIGLLHIDIDGNDWWVWQAIEVIDPVIVIVEYNSVFGIDRAITVPYAADFSFTKAHHSNLYWGASLLSFCDLAQEKGYAFVGSDSSGNNAYFVRKDKVGSLKVLTAQEGYVSSRYREGRDEKGGLTYVSGKDRIEVIRGMQVYNTRKNQLEVL